MVRGETTIMVVSQHKGRKSSTPAIRQMIRGQVTTTIQDTIKEAGIMGHQRILRGHMTLGTMVIHVLGETQEVM